MKNLGIKMRLADDTLQEIKEMLDDGLSIKNISRYLGVSITSIGYHFFPKMKDAYKKSTAKWVNKNHERNLRRMKEYNKRVMMKVK